MFSARMPTSVISDTLDVLRICSCLRNNRITASCAARGMIYKIMKENGDVPMECISPLSMFAFSRFDMASTVQLRSALRLLLGHFLDCPSGFSSVASSEQSFSRFMNNVKYLEKKANKYGHFDVYCLKLTFLIGMCGKPKFGSDYVFKNRTVKKLTSVQTVFPRKMHAIRHSNKK